MTANEKRSLAVQYMEDRIKKNDYTQGSKRTYLFGYPDNVPGNRTQPGYSDCSAAAMKAIKAAAGINIGSNTSAQINNRDKGLVVDETTGFYPDLDKLLPGDCLYFKGNASHPLDVGHVEMYMGNGKCIGHGSGKGPTIKNVKDYCKSRANSKRRYFMTIRWILDDDAPVPPSTERRNLKKGMYGVDVKALQHALVTLGYSVGKWGVDGDFGADTENAVLAFQINNQLLNTGIVDDATWRKIDQMMSGESDPGDDEPTEPLPTPIQNGVKIANGRWNVRKGPGTEFASAGIVRGGDELERLELEGWIPVFYNGEVCFIGPSAVKK